MLTRYRTWPQPWRLLFVPAALVLIAIALIMEHAARAIWSFIDND
jgi:hypothetical protein